MILLEPYVKFLVKHNLTEKEFLILLLLYYKRADLAALYRDKFNNGNATTTMQDIEVLAKKGMVTIDRDGQYNLTDTFLEIFIDKDEATEQIFDIYPTSMLHNGVTIPLKAMDRSIFANLYMNAIMGSLDEHREVIKDIEFAIENKLLNIGIEKFIKSRYWLGIRKDRLAKNVRVTTNTSIDYNF